jgi:hypothetical protein
MRENRRDNHDKEIQKRWLVSETNIIYIMSTYERCRDEQRPRTINEIWENTTMLSISPASIPHIIKQSTRLANKSSRSNTTSPRYSLKSMSLWYTASSAMLRWSARDRYIGTSNVGRVFGGVGGVDGALCQWCGSACSEQIQQRIYQIG